MSIWDWFLPQDDIDRQLDERIKAVDDRIAAKEAILKELSESCDGLRQQVRETQKIVSSCEKTINRQSN